MGSDRSHELARRAFTRPRFEGAACRGARTDAFFADLGPAVHAAKAVCRRCHEQDACLVWGLAFEEFGIWGGMTARERAAVRRQERSALAAETSLRQDGAGD